MSDTQTYNGWSNYETWLAYCWISSDESGCKMLDELRISDGTLGDKAELLKSYYDYDSAFDVGLDRVLPEAGLLTDLLRNSLSQINWAEIAQDS
jgi:hypothetical protein